MAAKKDSTRTKGFEDLGSLGDMRDRFRKVYKPGANKPKGIKTLPLRITPKPKPAKKGGK